MRTLMKINDGIPSPRRSENKALCFLDDSLNKNIASEK